MALLGQAALAMWWNMAPGVREEFEDWHTHEHFPERLGLPGFLRGSRWTSAQGGDGIFVLYELGGYQVLSSPEYLARLNAPTPWSAKLMPHHRDMVRTQNRVLNSRGAAIARAALTIQLAPVGGRFDALRAGLQSLIDGVVARPGIAGAHLLRHETPAIAQTTEQKIRGGGDQAADCVLVVCAYDSQVLLALAAGELSAQSLQRLGAASGAVSGIYALSACATPQDVR
jgi:hypothetical protein